MKGNIAILPNGIKQVGNLNYSESDQEIMQMMKAMKLPAMLNEYMRMVETDELAKLTAEEAIGKLLSVQMLSRRENSTNRRVAKAHLWFEDASLLHLSDEGITVDRAVLNSVTRFNFIANGGVVNIVGGTNTARTYLAYAIAREACANGFDAFYIRFPSFADENSRAESERWIYSDAGFLRNVDLLVIDNFVEMEGGIDEDARNRFKDLMDYRSRNKGTIFTSFLSPEGWPTRLTSSRNVSSMMRTWFSKGQTFNLGSGDTDAQHEA